MQGTTGLSGISGSSSERHGIDRLIAEPAVGNAEARSGRQVAMIKSIQLEEDRFELRLEFIGKVGRTSARIYELGIQWTRLQER